MNPLTISDGWTIFMVLAIVSAGILAMLVSGVFQHRKDKHEDSE